MVKQSPRGPFFALAFFFAAGSGLACTMTPTNPPPPNVPAFPWIIVKAIGDPEFLIGTYVDLFGPTATTMCACGLGASGPGFPPLPPGFMVLGAEVDVLNTTGPTFVSKVADFNFSSSAGVSALLSASFAGPTWQGFAAGVLPFTPVSLPAGQRYALLFDVKFDSGDLNALLPSIRFAAGAPGVEGHDLALFQTPEPSTFVLLGIAFGVAMVTRFRVSGKAGSKEACHGQV